MSLAWRRQLAGWPACALQRLTSRRRGQVAGTSQGNIVIMIIIIIIIIIIGIITVIATIAVVLRIAMFFPLLLLLFRTQACIIHRVVLTITSTTYVS